MRVKAERKTFPFLFGGTFSKADQRPLKMTVGQLVLYLEV